ncbi:hypothetical protein CR513_09707, partial [Mucuna pruriens]
TTKNPLINQPWCIQYPQLEPAQTYELKFGLIHLRGPPQTFEGIPCGLFHNEAVGDIGGLHQNEDVSILLGWSNKDWLYFQPTLFNTWGDMKRTFLEKFFPTSKTASIRKEICRIRQHTGETLHEYWERFNKLSTPSDQRIVADPIFL